MRGDRKTKGVCLISLGGGILLALVLPVGCIILVSAVMMILVGIGFLKGR